MRPLRPGQDAVLSWPAGAVDCRVVAAAGSFVLLRPERVRDGLPQGTCSLTYLDGMIPVGWDGMVELGSEPGELRFRVDQTSLPADRRSSVRLPVSADVEVIVGGEPVHCQMLDVSAGGMRFRSNRRFAPETPMQVRCTLPGDGPAIDADAVVRASDPGTTAVEFTAFRSGGFQVIGSWTVSRLRASLSGQG